MDDQIVIELLDNYYATYKTYLKRCRKLYALMNATHVDMPESLQLQLDQQYHDASILKDKYKKLFLAELAILDDEEGYDYED